MKKSLVGVPRMPGFSKFIFNWCPFLRHFVYFQTSGNWFVTVRVEIFNVLSVNLSRKKFSLLLTLAMVTLIFLEENWLFYEKILSPTNCLYQNLAVNNTKRIFSGEKLLRKLISIQMRLWANSKWMYNLDLLRLNPPKILFNKLTIQMWYPSPKRVVHNNASWI